MQTTNRIKPESGEYAPYYDRYISRVPPGDILTILEEQMENTMGFCADIDEEKAGYRYGEGKWSLKEVVGHIVDTERILAYRAFRFARKDETPLPGFEQDDYVKHSNYRERTLQNILKEFRAVRNSTIALFGNFDDAVWTYQGVASGFNISVRALAYILAGHELHHRKILEERYLSRL